jgi:hypothetical protein
MQLGSSRNLQNRGSHFGTDQKNIRVTSIMEQSQQDEADAAYARYMGNQALLSGDIAMAGTLFGGGAGALKSGAPPSPIQGGVSTFFSPF